MTDPISVLLIVGAAVIGPVEARNNGLTDECMSMKERPPSITQCLRYETLPELCERAMKEIGIVQFYAGSGQFSSQPWIYPDGSRFSSGAPVTRLGDRFISGHAVSCIPTPSGYRK